MFLLAPTPYLPAQSPTKYLYNYHMIKAKEKYIYIYTPYTKDEQNQNQKYLLYIGLALLG